MGFSSEVLTVERRGAVGWLWLDRPEARNAMGEPFWHDLPLAVAELAGDEGVRVVVVAARGPHFTVGLDLVSMAPMLLGEPAAGPDARPPSPAAQAAAARVEIRRLQQAITTVAECPQPVIAAVHGYCLGAGVDLVTACDLRLAAANAVLSVRETRMAIVADLGSLQRLPRIVGAGHVAELAFTGRDVDAARAHQIGLVNEVYPDVEALHAGATALAAEIAGNSPLAVRGTKAVLAAGDGRTVGEGLAYVAAWNASMLRSDDVGEAVTAFLEKRPPDFTGR